MLPHIDQTLQVIGMSVLETCCYAAKVSVRMDNLVSASSHFYGQGKNFITEEPFLSAASLFLSLPNSMS